jgi:hypothetical protein
MDPGPGLLTPQQAGVFVCTLATDAPPRRWDSMESETYRGYEIMTEPNGKGWRVWAHPRSPELPITSHESFHVDADSPEEALGKVRQKINDLLSLL